MQQVQRAGLEQRQQLSLKMGIKQIQSLRLMELPLTDLRERVEAELERNPALELLTDPGAISLADAGRLQRTATAGTPGDESPFATSSDPGFQRGEGGIYGVSWGNGRRGSSADSDAANAFIEGTLAHAETLQEHLLWQLRLQKLDIRENDGLLRSACELLIQNLNDDGFHQEDPRLVLLGAGVNFWAGGAGRSADAVVEQALAVIQALDPAGCATRDYTEAILVQARLDYGDDEAALIARLFSALMDNEKIKGETRSQGFLSDAAAKALAKKSACDEDEVASLYQKLRQLNPFPGRRIAGAEVRYVVPDIRVVRTQNGVFSIVLNNEEIPVLGIQPYFMAMENSIDDKTARDYVRENLKEARWFIASINKRNHTLLKVTRAIIHFQRDFFDRGPKYIAPLTLSAIAGALDIHETTVSRAASGKYMQTEWGVFELRHFFTNSISGSGSAGSSFSKQGVKEVLREILQSANAAGLSDQALAGKLEERGIKLARRTVAKYRNELALGTSYER
jgi:RNA polymerase sigma-54 factor